MNQLMDLRVENENVFFAKESLVKIGDQEIKFLKEKVKQSVRKSVRLCVHKDILESVHEMLIIHSKEAYIRPHQHPHKDVSYHIIEGIADMVIFDEKGNILDVVALGEYGTGRHYFYRLNEVYYYTPVVRSDFLLFHETMNGPFKPSDTVYASWAAADSDPVALDRFREELASKINEFNHSCKKGTI